jgi:hypothetical protein
MNHSRATGVIRLITAVYLMVGSVVTLANPWRAIADQGVPMSVVLAVAGLSFALGAFLLTGFMSRVCGLALACLGAWQLASVGANVIPALEALIGVHLMLRGGGAWAMDIYVQKMQDRVRSREVASRESRVVSRES